MSRSKLPLLLAAPGTTFAVLECLPRGFGISLSSSCWQTWRAAAARSASRLKLAHGISLLIMEALLDPTPGEEFSVTTVVCLLVPCLYAKQTA